MIALRWAILVLWFLLPAVATCTLVWTWNSKERSEYVERSFQPLYDLWRLRARAVGAASLGLLSSILAIPQEVASLLHGGAAAEGGYSEIADRLADVGFSGFFFFALLTLTANFWGRPRWVIPPYLRPVRKRDRVTAPREPDE
ncbi:poly-gamma-glutamate hydrolase family protein [Actinotalea sp. K2]|uniref:poly-gamma-glutamate hydrolase family protein n=1 Tax=Actinotalea sp. K2 TaxID=2939438 RepID=UPI002017E443|nr:poly-gamma-glutamate hydrolase family protein [Actinotalea sp. K2]MCL3862106.1 poly-gamma-glutamate hydrolase family protein [Actinotalea sp. K2]